MDPEDGPWTTSPPGSIEALGWDESFASAFSRYGDQYIPGRVSCRQRTVYDVLTGTGQVQATLSGAMHRLGRIPTVGDFIVLLRQPEAGVSTIVDILPRKTMFSRALPGRGVEQAIAANIDLVFIVTAAGPDLNARRLERYLAIVNASGAKPVILINKADLSDDPSSLVSEIGPVVMGVPVIVISARTGMGIPLLDSHLRPGITVALIGSSGVGKSTLINALLKRAVQDTTCVREYDGKGRHQTSVRQLFVLENGALVIDNPGLREVGIGTSAAGLREAFPDIVELGAGCHFSDCRHEHEPGCAVREAVGTGGLAQARLDSFIRLTKELEFEQEKADLGLARSERKRWKLISKQARNIRDFKTQ